MINHRLINTVLAVCCAGLAVVVYLAPPSATKKSKPGPCAVNGHTERQGDRVVCRDKRGLNPVVFKDAKP